MCIYYCDFWCGSCVKELVEYGLYELVMLYLDFVINYGVLLVNMFL